MPAYHLSARRLALIVLTSLFLTQLPVAAIARVSPNINVSGPATQFIVSAQATVTAGVSNTLTVTAEDQFGNVATGYAGTVHFTSSDPAATLPADSTLINGIGSFNFALKTAGVQTITATDTTDASITGMSNTITVSAGPTMRLFVSAPAMANPGTSFSFTVTAQDAFGNTTPGYTGTVHFTSTDATATLPADSTLTNGTGTFSATLNTSGGQTITATDTVTASITGSSGTIAVSSGVATHFIVSAQATVTAGVSNTLTVTAEDQNGNVATGYTGTVHFTSSDPDASLPIDSTLTNGIGSFNFALKTAGVQTITARDTVTASITGMSNTITVSPGPTVRLFVSAPAMANPGTSFSFTVTAQDAFGNTTPGYTGTVHFTSTDATATLPADSTLTNGTGTFSATLNTSGGQTITATDTVTASITGTSNDIAVSAPVTALTTFSAGLQMISAPSDYSAFTVSQIFSPTGVTLAVWQPQSGSYAITPTAPADTIRPGQGYWVLFTAPTELLDIGTHVDDIDPFTISLKKGWNMIGDPFAVDVPLSQILVVVNGIQRPFPGANWTRPVVMDHLYAYPAGATQYQIEAVSLKTYVGYWLFASEDCTLVIPAQ